jgi:hypothetical protein
MPAALASNPDPHSKHIFEVAFLTFRSQMYAFERLLDLNDPRNVYGMVPLLHFQTRVAELRAAFDNLWHTLRKKETLVKALLQ